MNILFSQKDSKESNIQETNKKDLYKEILEPIINKTVSQNNRIIFIISIEILKQTVFERNNISEKYGFLKTVLSNPFLNESQKSEFLELFSIIQRGLLGLKRFVYLFRYKKSNIYNTTDLYQDIIPINNPRVSITIYQNNTRYLFLLRELIKTINTALSNSMCFFSEPISIKNPYTNIPFNKSALYNIYYSIRASSLKIPILFQQFFLCDFDLFRFGMKNDELIREEYLKSYTMNIGTSIKGEVLMIINNMFRENNIFCLRISKDFPEDRLLYIMKPYLDLYYTMKYTLQISLANSYTVILKYLLIQFIKYNPNFGRKHVILVRLNKPVFNNNNRVIERKITFNDKFLEFKWPIKPDFLNSHLSSQSNIIASLIKEIRASKKYIQELMNENNSRMNGLYDNHIIRSSSNNIIQEEGQEEQEQMDISSEHTPIIDESDSESDSESESS
jgi:signal peptidase I